MEGGALSNHRATIARWCSLFFRDRATIEDVTQEVLLHAWCARDTYDPARPVEPWLRKITRRACIDEIRRRARRDKPIGILDAEVRLADERFAPDIRICDVQERARARAILAAFARQTDMFDDTDRTIFAGLAADKSREDIARDAGVSREAVKARIFRSHSRMRTMPLAYKRAMCYLKRN